VLAIAAELLGALGLITGFLTRVSAFGVAVTMVVAAILGKHYEHGFFLNWFGNQKGEGLEYFLLILTLLIASLIEGGGRASVDGWLTRTPKTD
jgi:putative oxidoreductase